MLIALIVLGTIVRIVHPFIENPFDFPKTVSDPVRHVRYALHPENHEFFNLVDPAGYQYWLRMVLGICGESRIAIAIYVALLGAVTPFFYYLWMKECLKDQKLALAGYAVLALSPAWILYSGYFMQESLMLPLLGVSLWCTWRSVRLQSIPTLVIAGISWGLTATTKPAVAPLLLMVWSWALWRFIRSDKSFARIICVGLATLLMVSAYAITPVRTYMRMHSFTLYPQDAINRLYFESGAAEIRAFVDYNDSYPEPMTQRFFTIIQSPAVFDKPLRPLSDWRSHRTTTFTGLISYLGSQPMVSPEVSLNFSDRLLLTGDGIVFFLFGDTWPIDDANPEHLLNQLAMLSRWLWAPLVAFVVYRIVRRRQITTVTSFCVLYLLFLLFQQSVVMEGRYRLPWEGLAVAALLDMIGKRKPA